MASGLDTARTARGRGGGVFGAGGRGLRRSTEHNPPPAGDQGRAAAVSHSTPDPVAGDPAVVHTDRWALLAPAAPGWMIPLRPGPTTALHVPIHHPQPLDPGDPGLCSVGTFEILSGSTALTVWTGRETVAD